MKRIIFRTITRNEMIIWLVGILTALILGIFILTKVVSSLGPAFM